VGGLSHPMSLIHMIMLITCLRDPSVVELLNLKLNSKSSKFCVVWTIKLSRRFFRINWSRMSPHSQKINCFWWHFLQVCKSKENFKLGNYLFQESKKSYTTQIPDSNFRRFCLTLSQLGNAITSWILRVSLFMLIRL
jgi:hypothetical protein